MISVNYDMLTPVRFLERSAVAYADNIAVLHGKTRRTYVEFYDRVCSLAAALTLKRTCRCREPTMNHFWQQGQANLRLFS